MCNTRHNLSSRAFTLGSHSSRSKLGLEQALRSPQCSTIFMSKAESALYSRDKLRTPSDVKACRAALAVLRQRIDDFAADVRQLGAVLTDERIDDARVGRGASAMDFVQEAEQSRKLAHAQARVLEEHVRSLPLQLGANGHPNWARRAQLLAPRALEAAGFTPRPLFELLPAALVAGCPGSPYESEEAVRESIANTGAVTFESLEAALAAEPDEPPPATCDSLTRDIVMAHDVVRKDSPEGLKMSVGFASTRSKNNRSYRSKCFALALLVLCVPQGSATATTTPPSTRTIW